MMYHLKLIASKKKRISLHVRLFLDGCNLFLFLIITLKLNFYLPLVTIYVSVHFFKNIFSYLIFSMLYYNFSFMRSLSLFLYF